MMELTNFHFFSNFLILTSACAMFGAALFLIWQAPHKRLNQIMAAWAVTVAFSLLLQLVGASYAQLNLDYPEFVKSVSILWTISTYVIVYCLFVGMLVYTRPWSAAVRSRLIIVGSVYLLFLISVSYYGVSEFPFPLRFDPISGIPSITTFVFDLAGTSFNGLRAMLGVAAALYTFIGVFSLPLLIWKTDSNVYLKYGVVSLCITVIIVQIPLFMKTGLSPLVIVIPDLLIVYAILDDNLFAPLKAANEELLRNKHTLEVAYYLAEKEVNQQTKELIESLQREQKLSQQLEEALLKAENLSYLKTKIIDNVSHEFRTPLTIINNSVEMLNRFGDSLNDARRKKYFARISDQIFYLDDLLQDILFTSQANAAGIMPHWQIIPFNELCAESVILWQSEFLHASMVTFEFDAVEQRPLNLDRRLLEQIGMNLLSNAIKYTTAKPTIKLSITLTDVLTLQVTDNGIGVLAEDKERIFELFERGGNIETRRGMGLGLYTVRQMAQAMGGEISVISAGNNQGSTFTVVLPVLEETSELALAAGR